MLKFGKKAVFKCTMEKFILSITILLVNGYQVKAISFIQGQEATLHFPYRCNSTVTLQQSYKKPFYSSTDGSSLYFSQDQVERFKVQNKNNYANCSLEFSISKLLRIDEGIYILHVHKDGQILREHTQKIWLQVDYPPGEASCVVSEEKGGDWVSIDCTAKVGTLSGKIKCNQDGVWMLPLTDPTETYTLLKQTILIRKSQPVFCCSSTLTEDTERCECDDTALYLDDASSSDPCPTILTKTSTTPTDRIPDLVTTSQSFKSSTYPLPSYTTSQNAIKITNENLIAIISYSFMLSTLVIICPLIAIVLYKWRQKRNNNSNYESRDP